MRSGEDIRIGESVQGDNGRVPAGARDDHPAFERHYRVGELAEVWKLGRETVRLLVKNEPGVIKVCLGRKRANTVYSVPESVARRIHTRLLTLNEGRCAPQASRI